MKAHATVQLYLITPRAHARSGVKQSQSVLSVCLSVCPVKKLKSRDLQGQMIPKSKSNIVTHTKKSASVYLIATKAHRFHAFQAFLIEHRYRVLHFITVSNSYMQMIRAYADAVTACSSDAICNYVLIRAYADTETACSSKEQLKCKYGL